MQIAQQNQCLQVFFKLLKAFQEDHVFGGLNRPTTGTTSYKVYIASCPVKRKRSGFPLLPPSLVQGEQSNRLLGLLTPPF